MAEDFGFVPDPPKKKEKEDFGFIPDDPASQTKREYVEKGGKPEDVYSPERARILVEQGPEALISEPPLKREDGSIAGPTLPTEEALAKGLIEKRAEPAVKKALEEGVDTVSSGYDQEKGVGFAVGRDKNGKVVRVEKEPDDFGFVPDEPKKKAEDFGFIPDKPASSVPDFAPDEKLSPRESAVARESLGRFAKGALVTGPAALARTYGLVESAAGIPVQGEPYPFESTAGARIASGIEQAGERLYPSIPEAQGSFIPEVAGGLGQVSTLPLAGPAARALGVPARMVPRAAAAGAGVVLGAGEGAQRASQAGAKPEEVLTSGFLSGVTGLSEVFPTERWIEKIDKATAGKFSRDVRRYFIDIGIEGGTEALQEGFQQVMGNLIAKGQYKPEQDVFEGAGRAALVGGTVGTIASGVIGGFGLSQARRAEAGTQTPVQAEATNEPQSQEQVEVQTEDQTKKTRTSIFDRIAKEQEAQAQEAQAQQTAETSTTGKFFYADQDGQVLGPIDESSLFALRRDGKLSDQAIVSPEGGDGNWTKITEIKPSEPQNFESVEQFREAFNQRGEGHRKFSTRLDTMIEYGSMTGDARDLILATLFDSKANDNFLKDLEVGSRRRNSTVLGRGGISYQPVVDNFGQIKQGLKPYLGLRQNLTKKWGGDEATAQILSTFWHEYGHSGYYSILTPEQKSFVTNEYRKTTRAERKKFFEEGAANARDREFYSGYYAKNESEWFAQSFAEWTITKKTANQRLVPVFQDILKKIKDVFANLFGRKNIESLNDIYDYILRGESYGEKPTWKLQPSKFPASGRNLSGLELGFVRKSKTALDRLKPAQAGPTTRPPPPQEPPPPAQPPSQPAPAPQPTPEPKPSIRQKLNTGLDNFRRTFQDKFVDVENLQKRVAKGATSLPDSVNIKQSEELFHGRVGERLTSFEDTQVNPLIEDLRQTGIDPATFEKYAIAKHARERNAVIADRNPQMPDGGSGMTNVEADRLLAGGIPLDVQARLEPIRQRLLEINRSTINNLLEGGLISQETFDLLTKRYNDYVPLRGTKNRGVEGGTEFEAARITGTGSGLDVRGRDIIRAGGRKSEANDILAYAVSQHLDSIVRSEKNRVLQTAARFATAFPDNGVIENVRPSEVMKTISYAEDGQTRFARIIDPNLADAPDIVAYKENGESKYLRINDPRLADVMKNRASPVLGSFIGKLASVNRYFAFINTQASPEFVISNFARDLQTALVNINSDQAQGLARDLLKNIRPALKATYRAELGKPDQGSRMDVFYRQFRAAGGRMTFFGLKDFQTLQRQIQSKLAGGGSNAATRVFRLALDRVGQLNGAVENATRLATFATLKERGFSDQQAAYAARNITVNFTRKGTAGPLLNAVYLFFNANIQGSARIVQALATSKKAQKLVLAVMVAGFFRDILNRIIGGEDETGMPLYDKIPEYQRRQNFIIMNPLAEEMGVQYFKFPMPYGYSVFDFAGQLVGDVMPREIYGGGKSPMQAATSLALAAIDNFNPIGGSYSLLQAISPTILTPVADLALNQDFSGRPIMPTPNPFDPVPPPDSQRYWNNVNPASKWVTEKINELTGGSKARAGAIDVSPETLDYGYEFLAGAVGKFGERVMMAPIRVAKVAAGQEDAVDLIGDIPMVRKVTGSVPSFVDVKRYQDVRKEILTIDKELKLAKQERDTEKVREILRDAKPELRLVNMVKATEQDLKELRTQKRKLQEMDKNRTNPAIQKRLDANRERQKALMIRTLERYNSSIDDKM